MATEALLPTGTPEGMRPPLDAPAPAPPSNTDVGETIDKIITMAMKMERDIKENAEDEQAPGELGRMAASRAPRLRRKSKELQESFQETTGPKLEAIFHSIDTDRSGNLDKGELKRAFEAAGRPADDDTIERAVKTLDTDGDGLISLEEFKSIAWRC